jgi:hypothetical protein
MPVQDVRTDQYMPANLVADAGYPLLSETIRNFPAIGSGLAGKAASCNRSGLHPRDGAESSHPWRMRLSRTSKSSPRPSSPIGWKAWKSSGQASLEVRIRGHILNRRRFR